MLEHLMQQASSLAHGNAIVANSFEHWRSMAANVAKNVNACKDVYSWDGQYLGTIVPVTK